MIKFFRQVRKRLLSEGTTGNAASRTRTYIKYAVGEIILFVIGILIAIGINNLRTNANNRKIENNYYCLLLSDLNKDNNQLQVLIEPRENTNKLGKEFIKDLHSKELTRDEIIRNYIKVLRTSDFIPTNVGYTDLLNSGNLVLLKNDMLKESMRQHQTDIDAINRTLKSNNEYKIQRMITWDNVLEFGWQSPGISSSLELDKNLLKLLPDNKWYLDEDSKIFQKCQEIVFYCMTVHGRDIELYKEIQELIAPIAGHLETVCAKSNIKN